MKGDRYAEFAPSIFTSEGLRQGRLRYRLLCRLRRNRIPYRSRVQSNGGIPMLFVLR